MPVGPVPLSTVEENMEGFLENQIQHAKEAKRLHHKVGAPTHMNFRCSAKGNSIENCPVTLDDTDIMRKMWGEGIAHSKGETARRTPRRVTNDNVSVPDELKERT